MKEGLIIPCDSEGNEMQIGDYVRYQGELWEIEDYVDYDEDNSSMWVAPRAGNTNDPQWVTDWETTRADISQLQLDI